tara:strand:+ start:798 stop:1046 length:249 start_codon:yes stop_codon:yes gene_type:complete
MTLKKPRSYAEAVELHPGINSIDDERPWMEKDPDGNWPDPPLFCHLEENWTWDGLSTFGFSGLQELRQEWDNIVFDPKQEVG